MKTLGLLLAAAHAWAQPHCIVRGVVTDTNSGKPVAAARLFLMPRASRPLPSLLKTTGEQGDFCFDRVEAGNYQLETQRTGYLNQIYGNGMLLAVPPEGELPPLNVKLVRRAILSGTVMDGDGEPVSGADVQVLRRVRTRDGLEPDEVETQETDDRGTFRFGGLNPGTYFLGVKVGNRDEQDLHIPFLDSGGLARQEGYTQSFYSAAATFEDARPILLQAGKDISGLLLVVRKMPLRHISGRVTGGADYIQLRRSNGNTSGMPVRPDGSFYQSGLEPGIYTVEVRVANQMRSKKEVDLTNGDADGVTLVPEESHVKPFSIPLQFRTEGSGPPFQPRTGGFIFLQRTDGEGGALAQQTADGTLQFNNVVPGTYGIAIWGLDEFYIRRILLAGQVTARRSLEIRNGDSGGIQIILAGKTASVTGRIAGNAVLSQAVSILLIGGDGGMQLVVTDQNGQFRMEHVAPGKYRVYAVEDFESNLWSEELATALEAKSLAVELGDSETKKVELPLIRSGEVTALVK